jgi:putative FmdB family regulatory protein
MLKFYDFRCSSCGVFEKMVKTETKELECKCGNVATRMLSAPKCFQNTTGKSPSASPRK